VKNSTPRSTRSSLKSARFVAIAVSLMALALVSCSSSDEPETKATPTFPPQVTQAPPATQTPDPTATITPPTGGDTPLAPTEVPVATEVPTKTPDPTSVPPTVEPTATPDPLVTLVSIVSGEVDPNRYPNVPPGDGVLLERLFPGAPPYSPHRVDDIQITINENKCVTCHGYGLSIGGSVAPEIPISHYTDALTLEVSPELDPRRYMCTSCHVPQVSDPLPWAE
jgi:hypothetical protein